MIDRAPLPNLATPFVEKPSQQLTQPWAGYIQSLHQHIADLEARVKALEEAAGP